MKSDKRKVRKIPVGEKQAKLLRKPSVVHKPEASRDDDLELIHELRVHQIELAQQNEELRNAQHELEESRAQYMDLYDNAPVGYFTFDDKGSILEVNRTGSLQLGLEKDVLRKKFFSSFMSQDDSDLFYLHLKKVFATGSKQTCALTLFQENGKPFYAQLDSTSSFPGPGTKPRCQTTVTDINERKELEEALKLSETRYRRLFEEAREGILLLDAETGKIADVNPFLAEMLGYFHEELLGKKLWEIGCFKDIKASKGAFENLLKRGYVRYDDLPLETKSGREIAVEFISNIFLVNQHKMIQCNIRDITTQKLMAASYHKTHSGTEQRKMERRSAQRMTNEQLKRKIEEHRQTQGSLLKALDEIKALKDRLIAENIFFARKLIRSIISTISSGRAMA